MFATKMNVLKLSIHCCCNECSYNQYLLYICVLFTALGNRTYEFLKKDINFCFHGAYILVGINKHLLNKV